MRPDLQYAAVQTLLIDFDSVICSIESLDALFEEMLSEEAIMERERILAEVRSITDLGMNGDIPFSESLKRRLGALPERPAPLDRVARLIAGNINPSFVKNLARWNLRHVHVISSGFRQLITPSLLDMGIDADHIHCNSLILTDDGIISGANPQSPLSHENGKTRIVESLDLQRKIVMVGDGFTDWQVAESGAADYFFAFTGYARRENVVSRAQEVVQDFDQITSLLAGSAVVKP